MILRSVHDSDLHGFVDGQLTAEAHARVAAHLKNDPADAARVDAWRRQSEAIRAVFGQSASEPVPPWLSFRTIAARRTSLPVSLDRAMTGTSVVGIARRSPVPVARIAGTVLVLAIGFFAGYAVPRTLPTPWETSARGGDPAHDVDVRARFAARARDAHVTYGLDVDRPVEVLDSPAGSLSRWLARHVTFPVRIPDLNGMGWRLRGGRVVPGDIGRAALLVYEDAAGERLSLYTGRVAMAETAAFGGPTKDGIVTWADGDVAHALITSKPSTWLERNAAELRENLRTGAGPSG